MTDEDLKALFPFQGGAELARAAIDHFGECIIAHIQPVFDAICRTEGWNDKPCVATLAEAFQYRNADRLRYMAETGLDPDNPTDTYPSTGIKNRCSAILQNLEIKGDQSA